MASTNARAGSLLAAALCGGLLAILVPRVASGHLFADEAPPAPSGRPSATFVMTRTGGMAGDHLLLVVDSDGNYLVDRARPGQAPTSGRLGPRDLATLATALESAHLDRQEPVYSKSCADQHHYTFSYGDAYYATDDCPREPAVVDRLTTGPLSRLIEVDQS